MDSFPFSPPFLDGGGLFGLRTVRGLEVVSTLCLNPSHASGGTAHESFFLSSYLG